MTFHDLPDDWPHRPLTDPLLAHDVLDLVVGDPDREAGGLAVLLCDGAARLRQPCFVEDPPGDPTMQECRDALEPFVACLADGWGSPGETSLLLGIARFRDPHPQPSDLRWRVAAEAACAGRVRLLGVHVVTSEGCCVVPAPLRAA